MSQKKKVLLKLTGEIFGHSGNAFSGEVVRSIARQIKELSGQIHFSIVIGGGNFFRGSKHGAQLGIRENVSHYVGMLATAMNGLILQDIFEQEGIKTSVFCALTCPEVGAPISIAEISRAHAHGECLIFTGGTGNPFFTTDTNAVLRALQVDAHELWKATKVDGVYTKDPKKYPDAEFLKEITYDRALESSLAIMDLAAFVIAREHKIRMKIFNIFAPDALIKAATDSNFGSSLVI